MKKVLVCAALAAVLAFGVGGCSKQEEAPEKGAVSEKTGEMMHDAGTAAEKTAQDAAGMMNEQKEAMTQQAGEMMDQAKEAGSEMMDQAQEAGNQMMDQAQQAVDNKAGTMEEKAGDMMKK